MQKELSITEAQQNIDNWIREVGKGYYSVLTNLGILTEEVGEVARILVREYGEQSAKASDSGKDIGDELADVLWVVLCLANQTGVNMEEALKKNFEKKTLRDTERHRENRKLK